LEIRKSIRGHIRHFSHDPGNRQILNEAGSFLLPFTLVEAKKSHHIVPLTEPDLIIDQILEVFQLARK